MEAKTKTKKMNTFELFKALTPAKQELLIIYFTSGVLFLVFSYLIYYCQYTYTMIRMVSTLLMFSVGFMFLSTGGKMLKGGEYSLVILTQWSVILCTAIALWVAIEFIKWNKKKQAEKGII